MTKILVNEQFGQNLKQIRLKCGLTQEQTVIQLQLLGSPLSRSTYALIESGQCNIYVNDLVGLQNVFNVEYSAFFNGIPSHRTPGTKKAAAKNDDKE